MYTRTTINKYLHYTRTRFGCSFFISGAATATSILLFALFRLVRLFALDADADAVYLQCTFTGQHAFSLPLLPPTILFYSIAPFLAVVEKRRRNEHKYITAIPTIYSDFRTVASPVHSLHGAESDVIESGSNSTLCDNCPEFPQCRWFLSDSVYSQPDTLGQISNEYEKVTQ